MRVCHRGERGMVKIMWTCYLVILEFRKKNLNFQVLNCKIPKKYIIMTMNYQKKNKNELVKIIC